MIHLLDRPVMPLFPFSGCRFYGPRENPKIEGFLSSLKVAGRNYYAAPKGLRTGSAGFGGHTGIPRVRRVAV